MRRLDIDRDGSILYSDLSEYIKPRARTVPPIPDVIEPEPSAKPTTTAAATESKNKPMTSLRRKSGSRSASTSKSPRVHFADQKEG